MKLYSAQENAFYDVKFHKNLPQDVVEVEEFKYRKLLELQGNGKMISGDSQGNPILIDQGEPDPEIKSLIAKRKLQKIDLDSIRAIRECLIQNFKNPDDFGLKNLEDKAKEIRKDIAK